MDSTRYNPLSFNLYAIYGISEYGWDEPPFDTSRFPLDITEGVRLEEVSKFLREDTFEYAERFIGMDSVRDLKNVRYALVHRFDPQTTVAAGRVVSDADHHAWSEELVRTVASCLRLIRPMRELAGAIHGNIRDDRTFDVMGFDSPFNLMEVPECQKLFTLRNQDADDLRRYAPAYRRVFPLPKRAWKVAMAAQFHDFGHFQQLWKPRYLLWASAIEALYTTHNPGHKGSLVAKERIKWFLGKDTSIYAPGDLSTLITNPTPITVGSIVDDLYAVRNYVAHGDKVPDHYFEDARRKDINGGSLSSIRVLLEAASFIIRNTILKILRDDLLSHFTDAESAEAYFRAAGLTLSAIKQRRMVARQNAKP